MAIEIKELIVKITVNEVKVSSPKEVLASQLLPQTKKEIINECVERVIEKLERKSQR